MRGIGLITLPAAVGLAVLGLSMLGAPAPFLALAAAAVACVRPARRTTDDRAAAKDHMSMVRRREEQVAHTAHELRTPLTAISTAIEMLRDGYASTEADRSMFLDQASVATRHMMFLINDVVDLAALENDRISLHMSRHRVQELIFDVAQVMQLTAQARGIALHIDEPPEDQMVTADRGRFLQVVFNLIANAIKYSEAGQVVRMVTIADGDHVCFEVHDAGPGVEEPTRDRLFTRFGRVGEQNQRSVVGTGLGLHLSKLLIERMNGAIGYRPGTERGSVFWFRLPRARVQHTGSAVGEQLLAPA